jgi:hypothetical protein
MWTVQEYTHAPNTWGIRVLRLQAPPPAAPTAVSLATLTPGTSNVTITVTGTSTDGSGFFDPGSTYPKHITASLGGNGVTVNSLTFISPTQVTLNVSVAATATPGLRPLTITNPDGQAVTTSSLFRVSGPAYTRAELTTALRIAGGLLAPTATQVSRLNAELAGSPTPLINIADAVRIARKLAGLEPNP